MYYMKTLLTRLVGIPDDRIRLTPSGRLDLPDEIKKLSCKVYKGCENCNYCLSGKLSKDKPKSQGYENLTRLPLSMMLGPKDCTGGIKHDFPERLNLWKIDEWSEEDYEQQLDNIVWLYEIN